MIGIIVVGHGRIPGGFASALELIVGAPPCFAPVDFPEGDSPAALEEKLDRVAASMAGCAGILIFTDLLNGTPFNLAAVRAMQNSKIRLVYGVNAAMLLESVNGRDETDDVGELARAVTELGRRQVGIFTPGDIGEEPMEE